VPYLVSLACAASIGNLVSAAAAAYGSFGGLLIGRGISGAVYEAVDMTPLGFIPALLPTMWAGAYTRSLFSSR